jgi:thiol-disulfide isomerase/thioredoxin
VYESVLLVVTSCFNALVIFTLLISLSVISFSKGDRGVWSNEAYKDKGVVILGVNTWEKNADAARDYMAKKKFTYGCLMNGDDLAKAYGVVGIPTLVIIGKDGKVAMADMGLSDDTGASLRKVIDAALAKK